MNKFEELKSLKEFILFYTLDCNILEYHSPSKQFTLDVWVKGKSTERWTVYRRYSEFLSLFNILKASGFNITIPPKLFNKISLNSKSLEVRRKGLETFAKELLSNRILSNSKYALNFFLSNEITYDESSILLKANMVLRISNEFKIKSQLNIGWRINKGYFTGTSIGILSKKVYMIQLCTEYKLREKCRIDSTIFSHFILSVKSPVILLPEHIHTISSTLCIYPIFTRGSLSDIIYNNKNPSGNYYDKYCTPNNIKTTRLQFSVMNSWVTDILYGLTFLHENEIFHGNLHSGNVLIGDDNIAKLSDFHSVLLGYHHRYINFFINISVIENMYQIDILGLGSILYELCYQCHPSQTLSRPDDLPLDLIPPDIENLLHQLVVENKVRYPSVLSLFDDGSFSKFKCNREKHSKLTIPQNILQGYKTVSDQILLKIKEEQKAITQSTDINIKIQHLPESGISALN